MADRDEEKTGRQRSPMHRTRRTRNIAIALLLVALVALFYIITIVRLGGG